MRRIVLLIICIIILSSHRAESGSIVLLNGFQLWQYKKLVRTLYGDPYRTKETDVSILEAHLIDQEAYMVFEYLNKMPNNIYSIQLTGRTKKMLPFKELVLGDDEKKIERILGKPSNIKVIEEPNVKKYEFTDSNYSIELDENGKLYSIRIHSYSKLMSNVKNHDKHWEEFKAAILAKDIKTILEQMRPDVKIFRSGKVLFINKRYSEFCVNPDSAFISALTDNANSVFAELHRVEPEIELRLVTKFPIVIFYKFSKGKILKEIVFSTFNEKYRIQKIVFQDR